MAQICEKCGKGITRVWRHVKLRGKYNPTIKRVQKPNLQRMKLATGERIHACTKCMKAVGKAR